MSAAAKPPTMEELGDIKRAREAELIRKWTGGATLSPEEMSEVAHIIPVAHLTAPPAPKPGYAKEYAHYAAELGYNVRNIKRLVSIGKKARDLPPFDNMMQLGDWWERMRHLGYLKQQVPQHITDYLARHSQPPPASAPPPPIGSTPAASTPPPANPAHPPTTKVNFADLQAIGLEGAVQEQMIQLSAARDALRLAREHGLDEMTITRRQKTFDATLDSLRKTEKAWQDLRKDRGDLAPVSDFRKDLTTIATTLRGMMKRRADNICAAVGAILTPEQLGLLRAAITTEGEREQALLRTARHWKRDSDGNVITD